MELTFVSEWLTDNKLSLHLGKTESILFASKKCLHTTNKVNVQCNGMRLNLRRVCHTWGFHWISLYLVRL